MISSRRTTPRSTFALLSLALCATPAMAQESTKESGFYVGAAAGKAFPSAKGRVTLGSDLVLSGDGDDETDQMWQVYAGYRLNRHFSIEAGYLDLGAAHDRLTDTSSAIDAQASLRFAARGPTLSLIAAYPMGKWEAYVKAGVLFSNTDLSVSGSVAGTPFAGSGEANSRDLLYGIGLAYNINERWQIKLDLTRLDDVGSKDTGTTDYLVGSLGFSWRF